MQSLKLVEAQFENGVLRRPDEQLHLRSGERVSLMIIQKPDPADGTWPRFPIPPDLKT